MKVELHNRYQMLEPRTIDRDRNLALKSFIEKGHSQHSGMGLFLPFILNYCEENSIPYKLTAHPKLGYYIERIDPI